MNATPLHPALSRRTWGIPVCVVLLLALHLTTGCRAPRNDQPVTVQIHEEATPTGRFRIPERQRDVWIAPQAVGDEVLQHEQVMTFVERPASWQLPSTIEPNAVPKPGLPLEAGDYDAEALRHQREIIEDARNQIRRLEEELEVVKKQVQRQATQKEDRLHEVSAELVSAREQLAAANQRVEEMNATERQRQENETRPPPKRGWKFW